MNTDEQRFERLAPLSELKDYQVSKDNTNVTGWRVVGADGEKLGDVKDLIVDLDALKVRYLSIVAERRYFDGDEDTFILIPIGAAALDREGKNVFVSTIDAASIKHYPVYGGGAIPADYEYAVRENFRSARYDSTHDASDYKSEFEDALKHQPDNAAHPITEDFYHDDTYSEERFYTSNAADATSARNITDLTAADSTDTDHSIHENRPKSVEDSINTIERLEDLRDRGSITEEEFILLKKRALES
ncbi:PRC-barrel domain-containing protein [Pontibacter sp. JH31]|uniref:PRC-barrel domain-containing protein n=1 Tax=Pontibacter aquaedesilientis TaxID=2766980 RepID=A0ABR7XDV9_9BACT|nr:PRC-barrel domain-containing protein [Pontibacter aquaedesilientis]MBD1396465.1 PRC-barrel domain-containing protein [Pontibacter aquaedesilientis]